MTGKKDATRFTIQFSRADPSHRQVTEILNRQGRYGKATYIANTVLHYISCDKKPGERRTGKLDEKLVEAVVARILQNRENTGVAPPSPAVELQYDADGAIGAEGISAVVDALEMFRKK